MGAFDKLPDEIVIQILENVESQNDLSHISMTSKRMQRLSHEPSLWLKHLKNEFPDLVLFKLFGPLDHGVRPFKLGAAGELYPINWMANLSVKGNYAYLYTLLSFCEAHQYEALYKRLEFDRERITLIYTYWQFDETLANELQAWGAAGSPKNKEQFNAWLNGLPTDRVKYQTIIQTLASDFLLLSLKQASQKDDANILRDLIKAAINLDLTQGEFRLLLNHAVDHNKIACAEILIKAGADVNGHSLTYTPLITALFTGRNKMACKLIAQGANVHALFNHKMHMIIEVSVPILGALVQGEVMLAHAGLMAAQFRLDPNIINDPDYQTTLTTFQLAIKFGNYTAAETLLEAGANPNPAGTLVSDSMSTIALVNRLNDRQDISEQERTLLFDLANNAKKYQARLFLNLLCKASLSETDKVVTKFKNSGLLQADVIEYLLNGLSDTQVQIDVLKLALDTDAAGNPTNALSKFSQNYTKVLKQKLDILLDIEPVYGSHHGTCRSDRPYLLAYGPQSEEPKQVKRELPGMRL